MISDSFFAVFWNPMTCQLGITGWDKRVIWIDADTIYMDPQYEIYRKLIPHV